MRPTSVHIPRTNDLLATGLGECFAMYTGVSSRYQRSISIRKSGNAARIRSDDSGMPSEELLGACDGPAPAFNLLRQTIRHDKDEVG